MARPLLDGRAALLRGEQLLLLPSRDYAYLTATAAAVTGITF